MKKIILVIAALLIVIAIGYQCLSTEEPREAVADDATVRMTESGSIIGLKEDNGMHAWLGIPYAKPPVGELRWKAPLPADAWAETRKALKFGTICTQFGGQLSHVAKRLYGKPTGSEDCLFLNIWAPPYSPWNVPKGADRLPVMVWIHGGGNSIGHGGNFSGKVLAEKYNVIVITFNYRLGPFGWFSHPALRGKDSTPADRSGNYGTLDIIRVLAWVQKNIAAFGGDPKNITVFGESAGGRNTVTMLLSPQARGLFHRAIVQSGSARTTTVAQAEHYRDDPLPGHNFSSREIVIKMLVAGNSASDRDAAKKHQEGMSSEEIAKYLRGKDNYSILSIYKPGAAGMISFPNPIRDGTVLPEKNAMEVFRNKRSYNSVPLIIGTTRDEYKLFMAQDPEYVKSYFKFVIRIKDRRLYDLVSRYRSDAWKATGADEIATLLRKTQGPGVYVYRFDWDEEPSILGTDISVLLGAAHSMEIPFVFNYFVSDLGLDFLYTDDNYPGRKALADSMSSYWTEFAYSGSPGRGRNGTQREWKAWDNSPGGAKCIIFDTPQDKGIRMSKKSVALADLKKRLLGETGLSQEKHCEIYVKLFGDTEAWSDEEYENLGREGCREYPVERFTGF